MSTVTIGDLTLYNVHHESVCSGRHCVIHNPLHTRMDDWPLHWRSDRSIFERICPHGVGHYDPSQRDYHESLGRLSEGVHGCDGCC